MIPPPRPTRSNRKPKGGREACPPLSPIPGPRSPCVGPATSPADTFTCAECGRDMRRLVGGRLFTRVMNYPLCLACTSMPGWFNDPGLAKVIDPNNYRNPPQSEKDRP